MSAEVLVIGIDALDRIQVEKYLEFLPQIKKLKEASPQFHLSSVHPPDSDTAWATIHTGLNPAQHGVVKYDDPLDKSSRLASGNFNNQTVRGNTFWDIASQAGKKVCVLFPHLGFPVWPVNGVMVGRSDRVEVPEIYPPDFKTSFDLQRLNVIKGMPARDKGTYLTANKELVTSQTEFAIDLMKRDNWDLFFVYSSALDMIQHYFWNYCDNNDPSYPGPNPYQNTIRDFYILHDQMIGKLVELAGERSTVVVLSDHGHGMRPINVFNINELLKRNGWLVLKHHGPQRHAASLIDRTKDLALGLINRLSLGNTASKIIRVLPWIRKLYSSPLAIDWSETKAFATNLSGVKAYTYGGIIIRNDELTLQGYEALRDKVIKELSKVNDPVIGERVVRWICRREELYVGPYITKYPHILFELMDGIGAGLTADGKLFGQNHSRHLVPGSHRGNTGMFLLNTPLLSEGVLLSLLDIAPTIIDLLDIPKITHYEGKSIFEKQLARCDKS